MSTDTLHETQAPSPTSRARRADALPNSAKSKWGRRGLIAIGIVAVLLIAAVLIPGSNSPQSSGSKLTHIITRGELLVTVTEQGTLESSENTEIKCLVRGQNTVTWVIESGTQVKPGDELVRLDTLFIEEQISERSKYAHWSRSGAEIWKANVARAELAIPEYQQGRYVAQLKSLEKDLAVSQSNLRASQNWLRHVQKLSERGFATDLEVEQNIFAVKQAELDVEVKATEIEVLKRYTQAEELERLKGELNVAKAQFAANDERAMADASRRDRAKVELTHCIVTAKKSGLVIYPSAAAWKGAPDIAEGATVHKDQVLLLMPDMSKMQVKVGIHESIVDRVEPGLTARVTLPDRTLEAKVDSVATVTQPAGLWTGNVVKYDTIIKLPPEDGLKPGMSAEVQVILARHIDVLMIPVAAVMETDDGAYCWVKTAGGGEQRRSLRLGDSNDVFIVVESGLKEGDEVVLNPLAQVEEAQEAGLKPVSTSEDSSKTEKTEAKNPSKEPESAE